MEKNAHHLSTINPTPDHTKVDDIDHNAKNTPTAAQGILGPI
jgi:hypothetical protein